jgi:FG-GAP-like repeat
MKRRLTLLAMLAIAVTVGAQDAAKKSPKITWKKTVVDKIFRSEGVGVADVNKDGKLDIITGDVWYEAPDWKMHSMRKERDPKRAPGHKWKPEEYSESFAVFVDDFNGDGYPDAIVIPFPGKPCFWYENPKGKPELWKEHLLTTSACNETPIFVDLFGTGKKVLVMAWQPDGKGNMGEMCYFLPGKDPSKPWERHSISGPSGSAKGQEIPYTQRFSHGLGHGDVNGDGRADIICPGGWWEQPAKLDGKPWKFHKADLGPLCADMHTYDIDGDGKADIVSSSAHQTGMWWHQQKSGNAFVRHTLFPVPAETAKLPAKHGLSKQEEAFFLAINKERAAQKRAPWRINLALCTHARNLLDKGFDKSAKPAYSGAMVSGAFGAGANLDSFIKELLNSQKADSSHKWIAPHVEVGVAIGTDGKGIVILGNRGLFAQFGQSHALHCVDINGDGLKDLVTGRRWWAHGPKGDDAPMDPAYLYWFEAKRDKTGLVTFTPHMIDDDSGIGTQFAVIDINGDGLLDVVISNKRGVYVFEQARDAAALNPLPKRD